MYTILPSAVRTVSGTATVPGFDWSSVRRASLLLNVTAAGVGVGDTLDVFLQSAIDGVTWDDFAHFTQVLGNGGAKKFIAHWARDVIPESEIGAPVDGGLAAGVRQGAIAGDVRIKWTIVNGGGPATFTFSLGIEAQRS